MNQKGELKEEQEGGVGPDDNTGIVGPSDLSYSFTTMGHIMVDHEVTPACLLPYITPSNATNTDRVLTSQGIPTHFSGTSCFTDPIIIALVKDPT